jgi:hypothetical protein
MLASDPAKACSGGARGGATDNRSADLAGPVRVRSGQRSEGRRADVCSAQTSMDADGYPVHEGDMRAQLRQAVDNLEAVPRESDCELSDVVRLNYYTTDVDGFFAEQDVLRARLNEAGCRRASTLLDKRLLTSGCGSGGEPRRCRNAARPAVRGLGECCWAGTVCRLPPRRARRTGGTRRPAPP